MAQFLLLDSSALRSCAIARYLRDRTEESKLALIARLDAAGLLDGRAVEEIAPADGRGFVRAVLTDGTVLFLDEYTGQVRL